MARPANLIAISMEQGASNAEFRAMMTIAGLFQGGTISRQVQQSMINYETGSHDLVDFLFRVAIDGVRSITTTVNGSADRVHVRASVGILHTDP